MKILLSDVTKKYTLKTVLDSVTVTFDSAKINMILGENGAGKSTLAGILSGSVIPSSGDLIIDGQKTILKTPGDACSRGIYIVNQRPILASSITALENILLGQKIVTYSKKRLLIKDIELLKEKWCPELKLKNLVGNLGGDSRFFTSLISILLNKPTCLILDEPSALLDATQREKLYTSLKQLAHDGCCIIIITHSKAEAINYSDTVTILNKGKLKERFNTRQEFIQNTSPFLQSQLQDTSINAQGLPCLTLKSVSCKPRERPVLINANITVNYGSITMISGIQDSALGTLENIVTGMNKDKCSGNIEVNLNKCKYTFDLTKNNFTASFLRNHNVAIIPSDRTYRASNPNLTIKQILTSYNKVTEIFKSKKSLNNKVKELINTADVNIQPNQKASDLSGGMLQRLILAREESLSPQLLILCEPMQGLDIEAQSKLLKKIITFAQDGKAVLILGSSDFPLSSCSKVYSLEGGVTSLSFENIETKHFGEQS